MGAFGADVFGDEVGVFAQPVAGAFDVDDDGGWSRRSSSAVATTGSPNNSPHSAKPRLEVRIMAPFW